MGIWPFKRRIALQSSGIFDGFTDWHSHVLPGVDDGVRTMSESLSILGCYERLGISELWCTPHIMEDMPNTTSRLREVFSELQEAYSGGIRLRLASENMLDNLFGERLEDGDLLPLGDDGSRLLVETSYFNPPMDLLEILRRIKSRGYVPVLAHPERYMYIAYAEYAQLKAEGVEFQLNLPSLSGFYGKHARAKAEWLRRRRFYEYMGTDVHNLHMAESFFDKNEKK